MPSFQTRRRVKHSASQMFDLVADVEKYPEFLPLCTGMKVRRRAKDPAGHDLLVAEMQVGYKAIRETFASRVTLEREKLRILVEYLDGPFSHLHNRWTFVDVEGPAPACDVGFFIDYEFRSRTLGMLMGAMFDSAFRKFAEAFEERADKLYGNARAPAGAPPAPSIKA